jgi:hypothetical protein
VRVAAGDDSRNRPILKLITLATVEMYNVLAIVEMYNVLAIVEMYNVLAIVEMYIVSYTLAMLECPTNWLRLK